MSLANIIVNNSPTMKCNLWAYDQYIEGFVMASFFGYRTTIKNVQRELKKKTNIRINWNTSSVNSSDISVEVSNVQDSDYSHMVLYKKDRIYESDNGPAITFFTFQILPAEEPYDLYLDQYPESFENLVYEKLYALSPVPILPDWTKFIIHYLVDNGCMRICQAEIKNDDTKRFRVTRTNVKIDHLIQRISDGLKDGAIFLPGRTSTFMQEVKGIDAYLHNFTDQFTDKIQESFKPLFIPRVDPYSKDLRIVSDYMKWSDGISLYPAQKDIAESVSKALDVKKCCFVVGEMGVKNTGACL